MPRASIYQIYIQDNPRAGEWADFDFVCHIDEGTVRGAMALENVSGNPGTVKLLIAGSVYEIPPGQILQSVGAEPWSPCTYYSWGSGVKIMFMAAGTYTLKFYAGYEV